MRIRIFFHGSGSVGKKNPDPDPTPDPPLNRNKEKNKIIFKVGRHKSRSYKYVVTGRIRMQ